MHELDISTNRGAVTKRQLLEALWELDAKSIRLAYAIQFDQRFKKNRQRTEMQRERYWEAEKRVRAMIDSLPIPED